MSGLIQCFAALKLIDVAKDIKIMDYGGIAEHVFGFKAKIIVDFMVAATQFSFAMCLITYITTAG